MGSGDVEGRFMTWRKSGKSSRLVCSKEIGPSSPPPFGGELVKTLSPSDRLDRAPACLPPLGRIRRELCASVASAIPGRVAVRETIHHVSSTYYNNTMSYPAS